MELLRETGSWLVRGASSHVSGNGLSITRSENWLPNPRDTYPRVLDALATFVSKKFMAGPISDPDWTKFKINSLMAVPKNNGDYRPVGNLSAPKGFSFNDWVDVMFLDQWPVKMTTAHQFAKVLVEEGRDTFMMC